jgi:hypothetical protein
MIARISNHHSSFKVVIESLKSFHRQTLFKSHLVLTQLFSSLSHFIQ